jgi:ketosteroid isomerase-like protein
MISRYGMVFTIALLLIAPTIVMAQEGAAIDSLAQTAESGSLDDFVNEYEETWRSHDAKRLADFFAEDAGAAIETSWDLYFSRIDSGRAISISIDSIRNLSPRIALLNVHTTTGGTHSETNEELPSRKARGTWVVTRIGGDWKIAALRMHSPVGQQRLGPGTDD